MREESTYIHPSPSRGLTSEVVAYTLIRIAESFAKRAAGVCGVENFRSVSRLCNRRVEDTGKPNHLPELTNTTVGWCSKYKSFNNRITS